MSHGLILFWLACVLYGFLTAAFTDLRPISAGWWKFWLIWLTLVLASYAGSLR